MKQFGFPDQYDTTSISAHLTTLLASTEHFYLIYKHYHWNLIDPDFYQLHLLFDKHAEELHELVDTIAERIRQMGEQATGDITKYPELSILSATLQDASQPKLILENLVECHNKYIELLESITEVANHQKDYATADYTTNFLHIAQQQRWFIAASRRA